MEITEVRIKLTDDSDDRLQAFCSITFDNAFVVRDLKIIDGNNGPFVAMPSRKLTSHCPKCGYKNHLRAHYCNQCGTRFREDRAPRDAEGRVKLYADIAHPINAACRELIQSRVIAEFEAELERAKDPNYRSRYDEDYDVDFESDDLDQSLADSPSAMPPVTTTPITTPSVTVPSVASPSRVAPPSAASTTDAIPTPAPATIAASILTTPTPAVASPSADRTPQRTVIPEPAAQEPRPPHRVPAHAPPPAKPNRGSSQFGAGIFD